MVLVRGVVGGVNNQSLEQEVEKWWCDVQLGKHLNTRKAWKQQKLSALRAAEQMGCQWKIPLIIRHHLESVKPSKIMR